MLNEPVLVLNRSWLPMQLANVKRSMTLLFKGHAEVVCPETFRTYSFNAWKQQSRPAAQRCLHTPHFSIALPEVMVLRNFNRVVKRQLRFNRRNIFIRDENTCQYCGQRLPTRELTLEHICPVSRGGASDWENVVLACKSCNRKKANRTPQEAGMRLLREPRKPRGLSSPIPHMPEPRSAWTPFLGRRTAPGRQTGEEIPASV
jgi:5-methylcytosine-specific restriction endonuclease McrA